MAPALSKCMKKENSNKPKKTGFVNKRRQAYSTDDLRGALQKVLEEKWSIYKAAKHFSVPWSTLKDYVDRSNGDKDNVTIGKMGRPFALTSELEVKLFNFIIKMQEIGFGLNVNRIRHVAYAMAKKQCANSDKFPFSDVKNCASWKWWRDFSKRYNLCLRTPENLSYYRANNANREVLKDFYDKLKECYCKLGSAIKPSQVWNCDETGLCYVVKSGKVVTKVGKKYVYNRVIADKAETHTVLPCVNAAGEFGPLLIIFKGVRMSDALTNGALPNASIALSQSGWINTELFLKWFKEFVRGVGSERPVILIMDSHVSHVTPDVLEIASKNEIIIVTIPPHTSHILQPLDVSVYKPLKQAWQENVRRFQEGSPFRRPGRYDFHALFNPSFLKAFSKENIISGFNRTGIFPLNSEAVPDEALTTAPKSLNSSVEEACTPMDHGNEPSTSASSSTPSVDSLIRVPDLILPEKKTPASVGKQKRDNKAKVHVPDQAGAVTTHRATHVPDQAGKSTTHWTTVKSSSKEKQKSKNKRNDDMCAACNESYSCGKNTSPWIQCCFCLRWFHESCQSIDSSDVTVFMCSICAYVSDIDTDTENE